ncbi:PPOX class F420-dependent oxidoreductase [Streptomyces sp. NBC_00669]|uniref:PPOX class F420-dependent oxidoreductase n=1 Tax=unclassified Streptomyces TaxID=2593676 RepID=UPI002E3179C2|nr:PPOX class F420-dependent oxidoreductase [Streptomyces sp. NBC_00669]
MTTRTARTELNEAELAYLRGQFLARLATVDAKGRPQANPVGFFLREDGAVDIGGFAMGTTKKWRNVAVNPNVSLVVDEMSRPGDPRTARGVEIRGTAEQVEGPHEYGERMSPELIRIHPYKIISWGIEGSAV